MLRVFHKVKFSQFKNDGLFLDFFPFLFDMRMLYDGYDFIVLLGKTKM